jgi:hypothetical protein
MESICLRELKLRRDQPRNLKTCESKERAGDNMVVIKCLSERNFMDWAVRTKAGMGFKLRGCLMSYRKLLNPLNFTFCI